MGIVQDKQKEVFITRVRMATTSLIEDIAKLDVLKEEWDSMGYSTELLDEDFLTFNEGLENSDISAVVGTTLTALKALIAAGHGTNLYNVMLKSHGV